MVNKDFWGDLGDKRLANPGMKDWTIFGSQKYAENHHGDR